jgi:cysteine desulfurase
MRSPIYFDHNATTPVDPRVLSCMLPYFTQHFGNAASRTHSFGWIAEDAVHIARAQVADLIGAKDQEIVFTSGATEAINLGIKGVFQKYRQKGNHLIVGATEHKAVLDTCYALEKTGAELTILPVDQGGNIDLEELDRSIRPDTLLVCLMHANNETGLLHPVDKIARIVDQKESLYFCDATQACGKIQVDVKDNPIALLAMSAHKMYGPKGTGALFVRRKNPRVSLLAQMDGGAHENGLRSGTLNVPGIVGFGKAAELAKNEMWDNGVIQSRLRTKLEQFLLDLGQVYINGTTRDRLPNTTNLSFQGIRASELIVALPDIAFSAGSACTSAIPEPSHVLQAMHLEHSMALGSVRFSLGHSNTEEEIDYAIEQTTQAVKRLRSQND